MKEIAASAALAVVAIAAILALFRCGQRREIQMIRRWAERSQFELLRFRERRFLEAAPFSFWTSHRTPNYFVSIRDHQGKERSGWVRLGNAFESIYWGGKDRVEVRWEEAR